LPASPSTKHLAIFAPPSLPASPSTKHLARLGSPLWASWEFTSRGLVLLQISYLEKFAVEKLTSVFPWKFTGCARRVQSSSIYTRFVFVYSTRQQYSCICETTSITLLYSFYCWLMAILIQASSCEYWMGSNFRHPNFFTLPWTSQL
jgi:hypothetical protein